MLVDALSAVGDPRHRNVEPLITGLSLNKGRAGQGPDPIRLPQTTDPWLRGVSRSLVRTEAKNIRKMADVSVRTRPFSYGSAAYPKGNAGTSYGSAPFSLR